MQWNRSSAIGIAKMSCNYCHGDGMRAVRYDRQKPCKCVFRAAFRACFNRFRECVAAGGAQTSPVSMEMCNGRESRRTYSRKREEFAADFCLVAKRVLDEYEHKIFRYHFLLGADWRLCCRQLQLDRGIFFHAVYRIEQKLGRAYREIRPYSLFPTDEYFGGTIRKAKVLTMPMPGYAEVKPILRPPVRLAA